MCESVGVHVSSCLHLCVCVWFQVFINLCLMNPCLISRIWTYPASNLFDVAYLVTCYDNIVMWLKQAVVKHPKALQNSVDSGHMIRKTCTRALATCLPNYVTAYMTSPVLGKTALAFSSAVL